MRAFVLLLCALFIPLSGYAASTDACYDPDDCITMLHMDGDDGGTTFTDEIGKTWTPNGNVVTDTDRYKFATSGALFDGDGDYLSTPDHADFDFGTGDFTVDFWWYSVGDFASGEYVNFFLSADANDAWLYINYDWENSRFQVVAYPNSHLFSASLSKNTWYHIALTRNGTNLRLFVNGTQVGSTATNSTNITSANAVIIGTGYTHGTHTSVNGTIDEFRITKGLAIWTANFTAPSAEYTECGGAIARRIISCM